MPPPGRQLVSPAAARNLPPILATLRARLPAAGRALEVASGPGEHAVALAAAFPGVVWQPSDRDPAALASIAARAAEAALANLRPPLRLDVTEPEWEADPGLPEPAPERGRGAWSAILAVNLLHVAPWAAAEGLLRGAGRLLAPAGKLFVYGPFTRGGRHTAPSNARFDGSLRASDPAWGVRDVDAIAAAAAGAGLALGEVCSVPANNLVLVLSPDPRA